MKKIKYLLGIGIFGVLFSTCFGSFNYDQIYLDSSDNVLSEFRIYFVSSPNATRFYRGKGIYSDYFHLNFSIVNDSKLRDDGNITGYNIFWNFGINNGFNYSIGGSGYGLDGNNTYFSVGNNFTFGQLKNSDYPLILNTSNGNYLSFENENTIAYNGNSYNFQSTGLLKGCFYGFGESISCYSSNGSMFNFEFGDSINYNTGVLVIPINDNQYGNFTGNSTLLLAFDNNYRLVYNIVDSYSNNFNVLVNSNIISAGYSTLSSGEFISKSFMDWYGDTPSKFDSRFIPTFYYSGYFVDYAFYGESNWHQGNAYIRSGNLSLVEDLSVGSVFDLTQGGGNQPTLNRPSYTTGQVSACRNPSYYGISSLGEGFSNPICDEINSLIYVGEDEDGNSIYVYYNDDGSWWVRTMGEANLTSVSAPAGFEIDSSGNVSTIWEVVCTGNFCDDYLSGLKAEDMEKYRYVNIDFGNAIILNTGYYENFFSSLNLTGYVFKCPYTYSNSRFVLGKNIIKKLGGYDPFLPINCFVASFENGRRIQLFDDAFGGFNRGPLMDGDTQNHYNLFGFFDILLSIGLIFFLMKFYHLFK